MIARRNGTTAIIQIGINNPECIVSIGDVGHKVFSTVDVNYSLVINTNQLVFWKTATRWITSHTERISNVLEKPTGRRRAKGLPLNI
jgi:uncharacterized protein YhfF